MNSFKPKHFTLKTTSAFLLATCLLSSAAHAGSTSGNLTPPPRGMENAATSVSTVLLATDNQTGASDQTPVKGSDVTEKTRKFLPEIAGKEDDLKDKTEDGLDKVKKDVKEAGQDAVEKGKQLPEKIEDKTKDAGDAIKHKTDEVKDKLNDAGRNVHEKAHDTGHQLQDNAARTGEALEQKTQAVKQQTTEKAGQAGNAAVEKKEPNQQALKHKVEHIKQGVLEHKNAAPQTANRKLDNLKKLTELQAREALEITEAAKSLTVQAEADSRTGVHTVASQEQSKP